MITKLLFAFITSMLTGITFHIPLNTLLTAGITGTLGWGVNQLALDGGHSIIFAVASGSMGVALMSELLARIQKEPTIVYIIPGIIPLVPGIAAYNSMVAFLNNNFSLGLKLAFQTLFSSAYIAAGLAVVAIGARIYSKATHAMKQN